MKKKSIIKFLLLFLLFLLWDLIIIPTNLDEIWNYGFALNLYKGLIAYKDFNMVITPLYPFIMSLPFYIFGSNILVFHIAHALILATCSMFLLILFKEKGLLVLLFLFMPCFIGYPSYNLFVFFLFVLLLYLERKKGNDYLIGFILALAVLTKQSIGFCLLIPSLYYLKDIKKLVKRFIGFIIPIMVFILYLVFNNALKEFLNLCFFGLFDFAKGNGKVLNVYVLLTIIMVIINLYFIFKDKKNILNYYCLVFYSMIIPLFDLYHFQMAFLSFICLLVLNIKKTYIKLNLKLLFVGVIIGISFMHITKNINFKEIVYPNNIKYFEYRYIEKENIDFTNEVNAFMKKNKGKEIVFLTANSYYFRIINDMKIGYIDLINIGNFGYHGEEKLMKLIKSKKNALFVVYKNELSKISQTDKKPINYVMKHGKLIKKIQIYDIYKIN